MGYIQLILFAGLAALAFAGKHAYDGNKRAEGRAELLPTVQRLTDQLKSDVEAFDTIRAQMDAIKANGERLKKQVAAAQSANAARTTRETVRTEYIDRVVPAGDTECERTSDAISKVLRK